MRLLAKSKSQRFRQQQDAQNEGAGAAEGYSEPPLTVSLLTSNGTRNERQSDNDFPGWHRPQTVGRMTARAAELHIPKQTIDITDGERTFSFSTPSTEMLPHSAVLPSGDYTITTSTGSAPQAAEWGRSHTTGVTEMSRNTRHHPDRKPFSSGAAMDSNVPDDFVKRPKLSAWKSFSKLFQKKQSKLHISEPFHDVLQSTPHVVPLAPVSPRVFVPSDAQSSIVRNKSVSRSLRRQKSRAEIDLKEFARNQHAMPMPSVKNKPEEAIDGQIRVGEEMKETVKALTNAARMSLEHTKGQSDVPQGTGRTPQLNVNIPNVEMERYSVMFEHQLRPKAGSLLERRHGAMKTLKPTDHMSVRTTVSGGEDINSHRKAPPPSTIRRPLLSLFPRPDAGSSQPPNLAFHRPQELQRSKTAPPGAISPARMRFERGMGSIRASPDSSPVSYDAALSPTPTSSDRQTFLSFNNDDDDDITIVTRDRPPLVSRPDDPKWNMTTSETVHVDDGTDNNNNDDPKATLNLQRRPRSKSPEDSEQQQHAVQISLARQVSISRARERVKRPSVSKHPSRPTVVELKNRKSTLVLIENA
ncbi:hypothetical protein LTR66_009666 [Elasticomyces elasticus]|nr:hypothetical protein LTR66_009666 [Elasticomyces elasticus]